MIGRRDLIIAAACLGAAGAAYQLKPRRHVSLLGSFKMADIVPVQVGAWNSRDVSDLVAPRQEGSLMAQLYGEVVERVYQHAQTGAEIMMLLAYGDSETNDLQLHRPETCYPAFGFQLSANKSARLPLAGGGGLPARRLVADAPGRRECIVYWSRLGEFLPIDNDEQRVDRLRTAFSGYIADGVLARFSILSSDTSAGLATVESFFPALVASVAPAHRSALIGTRLANGMQG